MLDPSRPRDLSNLATLHTISGGIDESWFYLITMAIEAVGARAMTAITSALEATKSSNLLELEKSLIAITEAIGDMTKALTRMPENCDPYIFYHRVRIYFSGWSNMKDLPDGLTYEGDEGEIEKMFMDEGEPDGCGYHGESKNIGGPKRYPGGSAAQSALIHALDIFLGVDHQPTGEGPRAYHRHQRPGHTSPPTDKPQKKINFLRDMRYHMPGVFRDYLRDLEKAPSVHDFLFANPSKEERWKQCRQQYNLCVENMKAFRDKHIQIVTRYIVIQAQRAHQTGQERTGEGYGGMGPAANRVIKLASPESVEPSGQLDSLVTNDGLGAVPSDHSNEPAAGSRGTGGTDIMPFLKQSRDETKAQVIPDPE